MPIRIEEVNALAELERLEWGEYQVISTSEIKLRCPHPEHQDESASATLNTEKNLWNCFGCKRKGDLITFLAFAMGVKRATIITDLKTRYDIEELSGISPDKVEKFYAGIWEAGPLLEELYKRGITKEDIRKHRLGVFRGRITIPVFRSGVCVNVRRYLPGATGDVPKFKNTIGHGTLEIYGRDQLEYDKIWICGGELKQVVGARYLNDIGVGAVSTTGGEGSWNDEWNGLFRGKQVFICFDIDDAGRAATRKIASILGTVCETVRTISLPLDPNRFPTGDLNDYVVTEEPTPQSFALLMENAQTFRGAGKVDKVDLGDKVVELNEAVDAENIGYRLDFSGVVSAMVTTPYATPKTLKISCGVDQGFCSSCTVPHLPKPDSEGWRTVELPADAEAIVAIVGGSVAAREAAIRHGAGIPRLCKKHEISTVDYHSVLDVRLSPELRVGIRDAEDRHHPALIVNDSPEMNVPYNMRGRLYPSPRTQQSTLVLDSLEETRDSLSRFELADEVAKKLVLFRPEKWDLISLETKLDSIWTDFSSNVSRIYGRRDLHAILDLSFHSPLLFKSRGRRITGWINVLIIGDSSQGKTETTNALIEHFGLGERVDCKNATVPGLLGGLQQLGNAWFVSWGAIPTHDRRWVVLEELKGAPPEVFSKLTDMRSSGIAEIPKIHRRKTWARTRLAVVSNARNPRGLAAYGYGVEAIAELIGAIEDVRRFDAAVAVRMNPSHVRNKPDVEHTHTGDLCRSLILWAWTLDEDQVKWEDGAEDLLETEATKLCAKFSEEIPLIDRGTAPQKIARIASAAAARTFSTENNDDCKALLIRKCHVEWAAGWLDRIYSDADMGYDEFSYARRLADCLRDASIIRKHIRTKRFALAFVEGLLYTHEILSQDIQDWNEEDRDGSLRTLAFLVRQNALRRNGRFYVKTPAFIELLKGLRDVVQNDTTMPAELEDHL